jgi:transcriptional regulator with XRE-family HTH domain
MMALMAVKDDHVAADLIAQILDISGLSQVELARRSGLQAPVLSAYAHGRRQPSLAAVARIARGAGLQLELVPAKGDDALEHAGRVLSMVLDLAGSLPFKGRGELEYPPLIALRT